MSFCLWPVNSYGSDCDSELIAVVQTCFAVSTLGFNCVKLISMNCVKLISMLVGTRHSQEVVIKFNLRIRTQLHSESSLGLNLQPLGGSGNNLQCGYVLTASHYLHYR